MTSLPNARVLTSALLGLGLLTAALPAQAQTYPDREIRAICNFPAGTGADIFVRFFAEKLSALAGKPVIVENRGGAFGNIGTEAAAKAKPDGYTILIAPGSSTMATALHTFKKLSFDPVKDFIPVTTLAKLGFVIVVDAKSPIKTMAELSAHLKAKGEKAAFGVNSNTGLITAELYKKVAGVPATKVQYRDNQTLVNDLFSGQIDFIAVDAPWATEQVKAGRLRAIGGTSGARMTALPDVPTMEEAGLKGYGKIEPWWGVFVPAGTPQPVVAKLEELFNKVVASEETKKFLNGGGSDPYPGNAKALTELLAQDIKRWGELVALAGIEPQ
jgi:tripartite-type tricarboxylate transporter receptor subunit TctC